MCEYIIKIAGQDLYIKLDGLYTTKKSEAYTTDFSGAEKIINEFNRLYASRGETKRCEMAAL